MKLTWPGNKFKGKEVVLVIDCLRFYETVPNTLGLAEKKIEILIYYFSNLLFYKFIICQI